MAKLLFILSLMLTLKVQAQLFQNPFRSSESEKKADKTIEQQMDELVTYADSDPALDRYRNLNADILRQLEYRRYSCSESMKTKKPSCTNELRALERRYAEKNYEAKKGILSRLHQEKLQILEESYRAELQRLSD